MLAVVFEAFSENIGALLALEPLNDTLRELDVPLGEVPFGCMYGSPESRVRIVEQVLEAVAIPGTPLEQLREHRPEGRFDHPRCPKAHRGCGLRYRLLMSQRSLPVLKMCLKT